MKSHYAEACDDDYKCGYGRVCDRHREAPKQSREETTDLESITVMDNKSLVKKFLDEEGWHGSEFNDLAGGPLINLLDKLVQETIKATSELCAQHVDGQEYVANSGMPADVMVKMVAKTFRSEDWNRVVLDQLSRATND